MGKKSRWNKDAKSSEDAEQVAADSLKLLPKENENPAMDFISTKASEFERMEGGYSDNLTTFLALTKEADKEADHTFYIPQGNLVV